MDMKELLTKWVANPIEVTAYKILSVTKAPASSADGQGTTATAYDLVIGNGSPTDEVQNVTATPEMCSRMAPQVGDYWVIQPDGYIYLNPKEVFERKYRLAHDPPPPESSSALQPGYDVSQFIQEAPAERGVGTNVFFTLQSGPIKEVGVNGCQIDDMIIWVKNKIIGFNEKFPCAENHAAIVSLQSAVDNLEARKRNRENRGVEGTDKL